MNIIAKPENKVNIQKALEEVQTGKKARLLDYEELEKTCQRCEDYLNSIGLTSKNIKNDIRILVDPCGHFVNKEEKYKYWLAGYKLPVSTQAEITYKNGSWRLVKIERKETGDKDRYHIVYTEKQKNQLLKQFASFSG